MSALRSIPEEAFAPIDERADEAREILHAFVGAPKRSRSNTISNSVWSGVRDNVSRMIRSGQWESATPREFVALYELAHERVYGVAPAELTSAMRLRAACLASKLLKTQFEDDAVEMASFMRWVWVREEGREKWRRQNGAHGSRINWTLQFNGTLVTDWRLEQNRHA